MSVLNSGQSTPFAVVTSEQADGELTEIPVPIVVPELLREAATQLASLQTVTTEIDVDIDESHAVGSNHVFNEAASDHEQHAQLEGDIGDNLFGTDQQDDSVQFADEHDDGFGNGDLEYECSEASARVDTLRVPETGWTSQQKNNLFAEINNAVYRYERNIIRGSLPWERGLMAQVFRSSPVRSFIDAPVTVVPMPFIQATADIVHRPIQPASFVSFALRRIRNARLLPSDDCLRARAMVKWRLLIELDLEASHLGKTVKCLAESLANEQQLMSTIQDTFASKSTATLFKRAQSIFHYHTWAQAMRIARPLLFNEADIYSYVCYLRDKNYSPTRAESFKQAVSFTVHTLGMPSFAASFSNRFLGACRMQYLNKRPLKQAPPLTVKQVKKLERLCIAAPQIEDRVIAGQFLFCLYASCRFSDSMYATDFKISKASNTAGNLVVLIDAGTLRHKTATTRERATTFLPLLATGVGLEGKDWATPWFQARSEVGLQSDSKPFMPAFLLNGSISHRRMTTGEASAILKDMLADTLNEGDCSPTTHSLKATVLSWLSKDGAPLELRRIAGHHMDPSSRSVLTYSRDALLSVLVRINKIILKIADGSFDPDQTRAEFLLDNTFNAVNQVVSQTELPSESEDDVEDVPDALSEAPHIWNHLRPENTPPAIRDLPVSDMIQHSVSGVIHFVQRDSNTQLDFLRCGRLVTDRYNRLVNKDPLEWPLCKVCESSYRASLP